MSNLVSMVTEAHPGTQVYNIDGYDGLSSLHNMWTQTQYFKEKMLPIFENSTNGVNMICFSQGRHFKQVQKYIINFLLNTIYPINEGV